MDSVGPKRSLAKEPARQALSPAALRGGGGVLWPLTASAVMDPGTLVIVALVLLTASLAIWDRVLVSLQYRQAYAVAQREQDRADRKAALEEAVAQRKQDRADRKVALEEAVAQREQDRADRKAEAIHAEPNPQNWDHHTPNGREADPRKKPDTVDIT